MALPNPVKIPTFVQILRWFVSPLSLLEECTKNYGDIFTLSVSPQLTPVVIVSNPVALQQILTGDSSGNFSAPGYKNSTFGSIFGPSSLISISSTEHQRQRQLLTPAFHGDRMRSYAGTIRDITEGVMGTLETDKSFSTRDITQAISLRTIVKLVFGFYEGESAKQMENLLNEMLNNISSPGGAAMLYLRFLQRDWGSWSPWNKHIKLQQEIDNLLYSEIKQRRKQADTSKSDILSLMMSARDEAGESMSDQELRDELLTLLIAGQETTATALAWALYWIHKLPAVREKLLAEIDSLYENSSDNSDINAINKLPYLNAVCCETLRIYPVAMQTFIRRVEKPLQISGYDLQPGTLLYGSVYLTHQRQDLYPEPKQFRPERFLEKQFSPYEFLPFGGGVRRCIGAAFALFEMKVVLVKILSTYSLNLVDNIEVQPKRRGLVTAPASPINMVITGRRNSSNINSLSQDSLSARS
ncbi:cytochrome P450 [Calothrix sp. PCC 6303]|uniref:cytochrome P450 n=1 Tax=Calothrix sp. PCC 6303 TaxID=1170562 RepID=UPI0002A01692|nr:cytochrome P450 [Calothrix sp. PCC 6303]AFZ03925.1 Unspecific monooxygenase [Calothrix sp. PCC 6303]